MENLNGVETSDNTSEKLNKAIKLLKEVSHDEKVDFQDKVKDSYSQTKTKFADSAQRINKDVRIKARAVDNQVKDNPWKYIGFTAALSIITGFFFGRRK